MQTGFGNNPFNPGMSAAVQAFGVTGQNGWQSDPVDVRGQISLTLEMQSLIGPSPAMLYVPSTTSGLGLLFVANAPGIAGNNLSITINAPAGSYLPATISTNAITLNPALGMSNAALAYQTNNDPVAGPLVQAYPWGIQFYGDVTTVPQQRGLTAAEYDLVVALAQTPLAGGAAVGVPSGNITLLGSLDPTKGFSSQNPIGAGVVGSGGPQIVTVNPQSCRWAVAQFVPNVGSAGNVTGTWFGRSAS